MGDHLQAEKEERQIEVHHQRPKNDARNEQRLAKLQRREARVRVSSLVLAIPQIAAQEKADRQGDIQLISSRAKARRSDRICFQKSAEARSELTAADEPA